MDTRKILVRKDQFVTDGFVLYRLLREDENPLAEGIKAKLPLDESLPLSHVRNGSRKDSQWISTTASIEAVEKFVRLRWKKRGRRSVCRVVKINRKKLENYAKECELSVEKDLPLYQETFCGNGFWENVVPFEKKTGKILDLTKMEVLDTYLPKQPNVQKFNERARNYATKYCEVLVERFVPANCCICVIKYT
ncbi:uncharacterized protein LOC128555835 [Mercenaria mercenaria]|uniref:uncharacterized protein LOC128555835 n=1 Tax=Mercenaria mercenaria TaxID=6596 RepID=UPI00234E91E8|nr:uncharacterized protein LOC128555835 [Mercenaria mercenaria]